MSSCGYCLQDWDEFRVVPRVLSCGHSYCENCIQHNVTSMNEFVCAECQLRYLYSDLRNAPVNRTLLALCSKSSSSRTPLKNLSSICKQLDFNESNEATDDLMTESCSNMPIGSYKQRKIQNGFNWQQSNCSTASTTFGSSPNDHEITTGFSNPFVTPCKQQLASAFLDSDRKNFRESSHMLSEQQPRFSYSSQNCCESANKTFSTMFQSNNKPFTHSKPIFVDFD